MAKTEPEAFSPNPTASDLIRVGLQPFDGDEATLDKHPTVGRPRKDQDPLVPVAGRIAPYTKSLLSQILDAKIVPGVNNVSDAVSAALALWIDLLYPRLEYNGLTRNFRTQRILKRRYDALVAQSRIKSQAKLINDSLRMAAAQEDEKEVNDTIRDGWAIMEELQPNEVRGFQKRALVGIPEEVESVWHSYGEKHHWELIQSQQLYIEELAGVNVPEDPE